MNRRESIKTMAVGTLAAPELLRRLSRVEAPGTFSSTWGRWPDMRWAGPDMWGNRLQDWRVRDGRVECTELAPNRTLHCLTHRLSDEAGGMEAAVEVDVPGPSATSEQYVGFRVGAQGPFEDYRSAAVFGEGLDAGLTMDGRLFVGDTRGDDRVAPHRVRRLRVDVRPQSQGYRLELEAQDEGDAVLSRLQVDGLPAGAPVGTVALVSHRPPGDGSVDRSRPAVRFANWTMQGEKLLEDPEATFGPICFAQYTLHRETLKLTAQLAPIEQIEESRAVLEVRRDGQWTAVADSAVDPLARTARFRVEGWAPGRAVPYRVRLHLPLRDGPQDFVYEGTIAREPGADEPVTVAVFSCNGDHGFPDSDVVRHVRAHQPDAAVFLGDQFYEANGGFGIQREPLEDAVLDMLHKWYMFGWSYRDLFRDIPAPIIPDDHDVYHGNVWGEGGADAPVEDKGWGYGAQDQGGYKMPPTWVNVVQRVETSHLPDPHDPTPVKQGIGTYYTDWLYGGVSFAILEDRKFKSPPKEVLPDEAQVVNGYVTNPEFDITAHRDLPDAELLGERQEAFLADWAEDWSGAQMKAVLSQTNFGTVHTLPEGASSDQMVPDLPLPEPGEYVEGDAPVVDMDTNGWPPNRRDDALRRLRSCRAFHIAGDQHLATTVRYGVDAFDDAGFAFTGPALNNIWPRRWWPPPEARQGPLPDAEDAPPYTGRFFDGFDNRVTVHAAANPHRTDREPSILYDRMTGYGLVTFDTAAREVRIECWPRYADPADGPEAQYDGWPLTVTQADGDGRTAAAYLPTLEIDGLEAPVLQVVDEADGEPLYTLRLREPTVRPEVFRAGGTYTVRVGDGEEWLATLDGVEPLPPGEGATRTVEVAG